MTQYLGIDLLEEIPDSSDGREDRFSQRIVMLDSGLGARAVVEREGVAYLTRAFRWSCFTEADVTALRAFIDARKGRAIPFWLPSYTKDFEFASSFPGLSTTWTIKKIGYVENMFPTYAGRRHVFARSPSTGAISCMKVTAAVDNGDGTETLTLNIGPGFNIASDASFCGFLRYCRLADDTPAVAWRGRTADADLSFIELPLEAPL